MVCLDEEGPLKLLGRADRHQTVYELFEDSGGNLFLAESRPGAAREFHRLQGDWAALQDAMELFPEVLPFGAYPVDAG